MVQQPRVVAEVPKEPAAVGEVQTLVSPRNETRKVTVTILKKPAQAESVGEDSVLNLFLNDPKKSDVLSQILIQSSVTPKFHPSALEVYEGYLDEMLKSLKMILNRETQGLSAPTSPADPLNASNARKLLEIFRNFILSIGSQETSFGLSEAFAVVLSFAKQLRVPNNVVDKKSKAGKGAEPAPNTVLDFLVGTLHELVKARENDPLESNPIVKVGKDELGEVLNLCYNSLYRSNPSSVRKTAAECLGAFSRFHLDAVVALFTSHLTRCKSEDDFRQYASYQLAVKQIKFSLQGDKAGVLLNYLSILVPIEAKFSAQSLRAALYESLLQILQDTSAASVIPSITDDELRSQLVIQLYKIYEAAYKRWYKKPKTRLVGFKTALFMYLHFDAQKKDLCKKDIVKLLLEQLQDPKTRLEGIEAFSSFLRILPNDFAKASNPSSKVWKALVAEIIPALFVKKVKDVPAVEWKELTGILSEILRLDETLLSDATLVGILKSNEYVMESRCVVLRAFGAAVATNPDNALGQFLQPAATPVISQFLAGDVNSMNMSLLSSVLLCFPHLCIPEKRKQIAATLVPWALSSNPELWTSSLQSLQAFLLLDPEVHLPFLLQEAFNFLKTRVNVGGDEAIVHVRCVVLLLTTFSNSRKSTNKFSSSDQLQMFALFWMLHSDKGVRDEACRLLDMMDKLEGRQRKDTLSAVINSSTMGPGASRLKHAAWVMLVCDKLLENAAALKQIMGGCWRLLREPSLRLEDHSIFFGKTLHMVMQGDDSEVAADVVSHIVSCVSSADEVPELRSIVCDGMEYLHSSCLESFARIAVTDSGKKKSSKPQTTLRGKRGIQGPGMGEGLMLRLFHILAKKITSDLYNSSASLRSFLRDRLHFWSANQADAAQLDVASKYFLVELVVRFFELEGTCPELQLDSKTAAYHEMLMAMVTTLAAVSEGSPRTSTVVESLVAAKDSMAFLKLLRVAAVSACRSFFRYSPIVVGKISNEWIPYLFKCERDWGVPVQEHLVEGLGYCLNRYPAKLNAFALDTVREDHVSVLAFVAASKTFERSTAAWISRVGSEKLIQLCLLQLCSPHAAARSAAMDVANALASQNIAPGYILSYTPNLAYNMYVELALQYSRALSSKAPKLTPGLVKEFVGQYAQLSDQQKSLALQLLEPWCRNFSFIADTSKEGALSILSGLLHISIESDRIYHREYVQQLWCSIFHVFKPSHMQLAVEFLVSKYAESSEHCILSLASLTRTDHGPSVVAVLVMLLKSFADIPSVHPCADIPYMTQDRSAQLALDPQYRELMDDVLARENAESDVKASSAFQMLAYVSLEKGSLLWPFLPTLLHNAVVWYHSKPELSSQAVSLISNLIQAMLRLVEVSPEKKAFASKVQSALNETMDRISLDDFSHADVASLVDCFAPVCPELRTEWGRKTLAWGLGCMDVNSAVVAIRIFGFLQEQKPLSLAFARQISTFFMVCLYHGWFAKCNRMMDVLQNELLPLGVLDEAKNCLLGLLCALAVSCVQTQVAAALTMVGKLDSKDFALAVRGACGSESMYRVSMMRNLFSDLTKDQGVVFLRSIVSSLPAAKLSTDFASQLLLVSCAVTAQLAESVREDIFTWISSPTAPAFFKPWAELFSRKQFHLKAFDRRRFCVDFADAMIKAFPKMYDFVEILVILLRNGVDAWKASCYRLLNSMIQLLPVALSQKQFKLMCELSTFHCYSTNAEIRGAAERMILDLISQYRSDCVPAQVLTLVRVIPANMNAHLEQDRIPSLFPGDYALDFVQSLKQSVVAFHALCLAGQRDGAVAASIRERFKDPRKLQFLAEPAEPEKPKKVAPHIDISASSGGIVRTATKKQLPVSTSSSGGTLKKKDISLAAMATSSLTLIHFVQELQSLEASSISEPSQMTL